jgi:hypothetical protein
MLRTGVAASWILILICAGLAPAQTIPEQPIPQLRIKSPFAGSVCRFATDRNGDFVALSNADGLVTVWAVSDPSTPTTLRAPLRKPGSDEPRTVATRAEELQVTGVNRLIAGPPRVRKTARRPTGRR